MTPEPRFNRSKDLIIAWLQENGYSYEEWGRSYRRLTVKPQPYIYIDFYSPGDYSLPYKGFDIPLDHKFDMWAVVVVVWYKQPDHTFGFECGGVLSLEDPNFFEKLRAKIDERIAGN